MTNPIHWGILGAGGIANKFAHSVAVVDKQSLIAVASASAGKAEDFASRHNLAKYFTSYEALLAENDIQAVYVANTHNFHFETISKALKAGKHVLCEKPLAVNALEVKKLIDEAKKNNCLLMEGMWTRFLPAHLQAKKWLENGDIGELKQMEASFGFQGYWGDDGRMLNPDLAGGTLLDMGIYPLSFASFYSGGQKPDKIHSLATMGKTGVDTDNVILLGYKNNLKAVLRCTFDFKIDSEAILYGSKGTIILSSNFIGATEVKLLKKDQEDIRRFPMPFQEGFRFEIEHFGQLINEGKTDSPQMPLEETLALAETMDELRRDWGLKYPFE